VHVCHALVPHVVLEELDHQVHQWALERRPQACTHSDRDTGSDDGRLRTCCVCPYYRLGAGIGSGRTGHAEV
jgi:hypothetical protein